MVEARSIRQQPYRAGQQSPEVLSGHFDTCSWILVQSNQFVLQSTSLILLPTKQDGALVMPLNKWPLAIAILLDVYSLPQIVYWIDSLWKSKFFTEMTILWVAGSCQYVKKMRISLHSSSTLVPTATLLCGLGYATHLLHFSPLGYFSILSPANHLFKFILIILSPSRKMRRQHVN